jgi:hypothetical protein
LDLRLRRKKKAIPAMTAMAPRATAIPMPALAPLLNPLFEGEWEVSVELLGPVAVEAPELVLDDEGKPAVDEAELVLGDEGKPAVDEAELVLDGEPSPTVVATALAEDRTTNMGLLAPFPAVVFGLRSKLQLEIPCHTSCMS